MRTRFWSTMRLAVLGLFVALGIGLTAAPASADLIVNAFGVAVTEDFQSFMGTGFSPTPAAGQLDSDTWIVSGFSDGSVAYGGTATTGDFARGSDDNGGVTTGGVYSFLTTGDGNRMLGVQPTADDFTPGAIELRILNNTGRTVPHWDISYDIFCRNDEGRSNSFNFSYSLNGVSFTSLAALDFLSGAAADASPTFVRTSRSVGLAVSVPHNDRLYLRWTGDDVGGSGSRDEFGLDNVSVTPNPEPSTLALSTVAAMALLVCRWRQRRSRAGRLE